MIAEIWIFFKLQYLIYRTKLKDLDRSTSRISMGKIIAQLITGLIRQKNNFYEA